MIAETVKHWECMIEWVKTQNLEAIPDREVMEQAIGENWTGKYCALCLAQKDSCNWCALYYAQDEKSCNDEGTFWRGVADSATWAEWLFYAERLLELLKSLDEKEEKMKVDTTLFSPSPFPNTVSFHTEGTKTVKSILWITPTVNFTFAKPRPNLWRRFWYWALLGWRWEKVK